MPKRGLRWNNDNEFFSFPFLFISLFVFCSLSSIGGDICRLAPWWHVQLKFQTTSTRENNQSYTWSTKDQNHITYTFSKLWGILRSIGTVTKDLRDFEDGRRYFASSAGVGQYSKPLLLVTQRHAPALLSSLISWKAPVKSRYYRL